MGKMIRCPEGHFYDAEKHSSCPICGVSGLNIGKTKGRKYEPPPEGEAGGGADEKTQGQHTPGRQRSGDARTVGYWGKKFDPVVGWLVCIAGPDKGRDYRVRAERNFIGRSPEMDIFVENDEHISRKNHAVISYNPRNNKFKLLPGDGRALVYLNDDDVNTAQELKAYDIMEMGDSKFMFVPLCGEQFQWDKEEQPQEKKEEE